MGEVNENHIHRISSLGISRVGRMCLHMSFLASADHWLCHCFGWSLQQDLFNTLTNVPPETLLELHVTYMKQVRRG